MKVIYHSRESGGNDGGQGVSVLVVESDEAGDGQVNCNVTAPLLSYI